MVSYNLIDPIFYNTEINDEKKYNDLLCDSKWADVTKIDMKVYYEEKVYYSFEYPIAFSDYSWDSIETTML